MNRERFVRRLRPRTWIKLTYPWRFQRWGPIPNYWTYVCVVWHSGWRARLGWCRCMGCTMDKVDREKAK